MVSRFWHSINYVKHFVFFLFFCLYFGLSPFLFSYNKLVFIVQIFVLLALKCYYCYYRICAKAYNMERLEMSTHDNCHAAEIFVSLSTTICVHWSCFTYYNFSLLPHCIWLLISLRLCYSIEFKSKQLHGYIVYIYTNCRKYTLLRQPIA